MQLVHGLCSVREPHPSQSIPPKMPPNVSRLRRVAHCGRSPASYLRPQSAPRQYQAVAHITRMSPAAWRHILLNGHYTFQSGGKMIDLDTLLPGLDLG